jgi:hypothetical protein
MMMYSGNGSQNANDKMTVMPIHIKHLTRGVDTAVCGQFLFLSALFDYLANR